MYYYIAIHKGKENDVPKPANCTLAVMQLKRQDGLLMRHFILAGNCSNLSSMQTM
jgi:hypothetical protein